MFKLICVADFSSHYFKEVSSLSTSIEAQLNKDSRLDVNAPQDQRPNLKSVLQEIQRTRTKINQHQNEGEDSFQPKTKDDFSLLGLTTNRTSQLMSVKGKPISFKSRSKGAVDITIRNPQEFTKFLESGRIQRQHMSSLFSQVFDPAFIFNTIYHNIAKLINGRILTSNPKPLTMTQKVPRCHFYHLRETESVIL